MSDNAQHKSKTVKAIRGTEARAVAKWTADGWELVGQKPGTFSTELSFRRAKRKLSLAAFAAGAAVALLAVVAITIGVITEHDNSTTAAPSTNAAEEPGGSGTTAQSPATQAPSASAASSSEPAPGTTLTATNNEEFAEVLSAKDCDERIDVFATKHAGEIVEFAGIVLDLAPSGDARTRYDILIAPGNRVDATEGPQISYENVNTTSDFGWTGPNIPDPVRKGTKLQFAARVGAYNAKACLLSMTPVATRAR